MHFKIKFFSQLNYFHKINLILAFLIKIRLKKKKMYVYNLNFVICNNKNFKLKSTVLISNKYFNVNI